MSAPTANTSQDTGGLSENQAFEALRSLRGTSREPKAVTPEEFAGDPPPEDEQPEVTEDENAQPEGAEFAEGEPEATEDAEGEEEAASSDPLVKFDDGTELPLSDVKRGFLRQQDYTRKTQEVAESRKKVEAERAQYLQEKQLVAERLTPLIQQAKAMLDNPAEQAALAELRQTDPGAYAVRIMEIQNRQQQIQRLEWEQSQLRAQAEREEAERFQRERAQAAEQSRAALMEAIPAAKKDFAGWYQTLGKYVIEQGVPSEVWDNEVDHRVITLAWKAMQYDNATRKAPATKEQLRKLPQPMRPGAKRPVGYTQGKAIAAAHEQLTKTGTVDSALALLRARRGAAR